MCCACLFVPKQIITACSIFGRHVSVKKNVKIPFWLYGLGCSASDNGAAIC